MELGFPTSLRRPTNIVCYSRRKVSIVPQLNSRLRATECGCLGIAGYVGAWLCAADYKLLGLTDVDKLDVKANQCRMV